MQKKLGKKASHRETSQPVALTIAGSDCSGGAGLEADLKTFHAYGVYGMASATCVVAERPGKVVGIESVTPEMVKQQIACCLSGMEKVAVKTGMLLSKEVIEATALALQRFRKQTSCVVVDPVMVATSGDLLLKRNALQRLLEFIMEHATLVTPNLDEATLLGGWKRKPGSRSEMEKLARELCTNLRCPVLLKGGHLPDSKAAADYYWNGRNGFWMEAARITGVKTHGTGCTFSAAITAGLALGLDERQALREAKKFLTQSIAHMVRFKPWMALNHGHGKIGGPTRRVSTLRRGELKS
jgi:hydroxymethylpyrimidine/phosphomethylpyrimidine kinase